MLVVLLTQSRAGVAAGVVVVAFWLLLVSRRIESALVVLLAALPAAIVGGLGVHAVGAVVDGVGRVRAPTRSRSSPACASSAWGWPLRSARSSPSGGSCAIAVGRSPGLLSSSGATTVLVGAIGLTASVGEPFSWAREQVSGGECSNDPGRLADLCANNRLAWWGEALDISRAHPLGGTGAGTFSIARLRVRDDATPTTEPHSAPLQLLADTGLVGFALGLIVLGGAVVGVRRSLCRAEGDERDAAVALTALPLAFGLHALVDYDLDFVAVSCPTLVVVGALLGAGRPTLAVRGGMATGLTIAASALAAIALLALPELARHDIRSATEDAYAGKLAAAESLARRARQLDPLTLAPLYALADIADRRGSQATAVGWLERATRQQPRNPEPWLALGRYHFISTGNLCAAYEAFNEAYTLDPMSNRWVEGGPLDVARDAVNDGACEK